MTSFLSKKSANGFSLVETLVIIVIFALITGAIYGTYILSQKASREGETAAEITQNGRVVLDRIVREIRQTREMVTELSEEESGAVNAIMFEDGHIALSYNYIHYFKVGGALEREVVGYYFSGDTDQNLQPWDAVPPSGQTLEQKTLEASRTIGEYITGLKFWGGRVINIFLTLTKNNKEIDLSTKILGRNI